ncbi:DUF6624 domain-containing protein [Geodermatophilus sp. SYSU D00697]
MASDLARELVAMMAEQEELLERTGAGSPGPLPPEVRRQHREVFVRHADRLLDLLSGGSWPTASRVGEPAAHAAWLIAQHADTHVHLQRLAVRLLRRAVEVGEASRRDLAFLEDRLAVNEGRLQVYGTQIADVVDGEPVPWPCVEPERLDERRAQVGIEPFAVNAARFRPPPASADG